MNQDVGGSLCASFNLGCSESRMWSGLANAVWINSDPIRSFRQQDMVADLDKTSRHIQK